LSPPFPDSLFFPLPPPIPQLNPFSPPILVVTRLLRSLVP